MSAPRRRSCACRWSRPHCCWRRCCCRPPPRSGSRSALPGSRPTAPHQEPQPAQVDRERPARHPGSRRRGAAGGALRLARHLPRLGGRSRGSRRCLHHRRQEHRAAARPALKGGPGAIDSGGAGLPRRPRAVRTPGGVMSALVSHAASLAVLAYTRLFGDSEGPPVDRTGQTLVLIIVGIGVVIVVLLSVAALRGLTRSRRARWSEREYAARHGDGRRRGAAEAAGGTPPQSLLDES